MKHMNIIQFLIFYLVVRLLPSSYREEARYYLEKQLNEGDPFIRTVFDYFLGGLEYRLRKLVRLLYKHEQQFSDILARIKSVYHKIPNKNSLLRNNI